MRDSLTTRLRESQNAIEDRIFRLRALQATIDKILAAVKEDDADERHAQKGFGRGNRLGSTGKLGTILRKALQPGVRYKVGDIITLIQKAGYKTRSADPRTMINQELASYHRKGRVVRRVARGIYMLRETEE